MIEISELLPEMRKYDVLTLLSEEPFVKTLFLFELIQGSPIPVCYLDFDLQFSSFVTNLSKKPALSESNFTLYQPDTHSLMKPLVEMRKQGMSKGGLCILDSLNTLQLLLLGDKQIPSESLRANHKASIYIAYLSQKTRKLGMNLLITNILRSRRAGPYGVEGGLWEKVMVGGRMLRFKSDGFLSLEMKRNGSQEVEGRDRLELEVRLSGLQKEEEYSVELPIIYPE